MPTFVQLTFAQIFAFLVETYNAAIVEAGGTPADTSPLSTLNAIFNAMSLLTLQQQGQINVAALVSRLASSTGSDVDSFTEAFGIYRVGAAPSTGGVLCSTSSPITSPGLIPNNFTMQSTTGVLFTVIADPSNAAYSASLLGYVVPVVTGAPSSVTVTVEATVGGTIGNVGAGTITTITGSISAPGITTVTNPTAFTNGAPDETDAQLKARFVLAISEGRVATNNAIAAAVLSVSPGLTYSISDTVDPSGNAISAYFYVVVNSGNSSTAPTQTLLDAVTAAVDPVRALGISFSVVAPTLLPVNVVGHIALAVNADPVAVPAACNAAAGAYLDGIGLDPLGSPTAASIGRLYALLEAIPGVSDISGLTLNGGGGNINAPFATQLVAGTLGLVTP